MFLPWVGQHYEPTRGVAVLAINPNIAPDDGTDLFIEHGISWTQHHTGLEGNKQAPGHSWFAYRALRSAALLLDDLDGAAIHDRKEPYELVETLHRTARLQSVKCLPRWDNTEPTGAMWRNCPPFLLADELDILKPARLLVLGAEPTRALSALNGFEWLDGGGGLGRGRFNGPGWSALVSFVAHPSSRGGQWGDSHATLLRSLRAARRSSPPYRRM